MHKWVYIPIWQNKNHHRDHHFPPVFPRLHSNMAEQKFVIIARPRASISIFTFQYGRTKMQILIVTIWMIIFFTFQYGRTKIDMTYTALRVKPCTLHSNMAEQKCQAFFFSAANFFLLYIPIWQNKNAYFVCCLLALTLFTFQYGRTKIRGMGERWTDYKMSLHSNMAEQKLYKFLEYFVFF